MARGSYPFTAYYVPTWGRRWARAKRVRAKSIGEIMLAAQKLVDDGDARVVTVFPQITADGLSPVLNYEVEHTRTRIVWRASL